VTKRVVFGSLAVVGLLGLALAVGAQRPHPGLRGDFGHGGPGRWGRGIPACSQTKNCVPYQFTWTRTITRPVLPSSSNPSATPVTITTNGVVAGDNFGSTYYKVTVSPVGPWASKPGSQEFIYVRDLDTMLGYIQNVTKNTYEKFPIQEHARPGNGTPNPEWKGRGPGKHPGEESGTGPTIVRAPIVNGTVYGGYACQAGEKTTITGPDITTHRVYCSDLRILVEEDSTGPQISSSYTLSGYTNKLSGTLPFTPLGTLVQGPKSDRDGYKPGGPGHRGPFSTPRD
jgi:hypothetical protein